MPSKEPTFGEYLRQVRYEKDLSLRRAADLIGIKHSRLNEIEQGKDAHSGKSFVPTYVTVVRLAKAYSLPPDELLVRAGYTPGIELEPAEWELVRGYRALGGEKRLQLMSALHLLLGNPAEES